MTVIVLSQVVVRGFICATKDRPLYTQTLLEGGRSFNESIELKEKFDFMIAFGVRNANTKEFLHDPKYVEFVPMIEEKLFNSTDPVTYKPLGFHTCTQEDFKMFHPVADNQLDIVEGLKAENFFFCLDQKDQFGNAISFETYGDDENMANRNLGVYYRPCVPQQLTEENKD
jgi:hypothetical protein